MNITGTIVLKQFYRKGSGKFAYRVNCQSIGSGTVYLGIGENLDHAQTIFDRYLRTGKRNVRAFRARDRKDTERRCWIVPTRGLFEVIGHDNGESKNRYIGGSKVRAKAKAIQKHFLKTGTRLPKTAIAR